MRSPACRPAARAGPPGSTDSTRTAWRFSSWKCRAMRRASGRFAPAMPRYPRRTLPSRRSCTTTHFTLSIAVAKQIPCAPGMIAVFTPITSPREFTRGPPEFPGLGAQAPAKRAHDAGSDRVLEAVRIADRDRELSDPKAARRAEDYAGQRIRADADHRDVGIRIFTQEVGVAAESVGESCLDAPGPVHHVAVGEEQPVGRKRESGAGSAARISPQLDFEMHHRRTDALRRRHDGSGIGIEQVGVLWRRRRSGGTLSAFVEEELGSCIHRFSLGTP